MKSKKFKGKKILITGATGSIGSAIVLDFIKKYEFNVIRALSNDENGLFYLKHKIERKESNIEKFMLNNRIRLIHGDIRNYKRCVEVSKNIDIVIHAAAMKHVPICEYNPDETIKTNVDGTRNLVKASLKNNVKKFVFISTDKAANPQTIMGTTKHMAEKIVIKANKNLNRKKKIFYCIRFGNIIGSRGSVLEVFKDQIINRSPLTVTNKLMTRFFIDISYATQKVIETLNFSRGGEIFIIKSMTALKILDLAEVLSKYFYKKKSIKIIGTRPKEKIHEDLISRNEIPNAIENKKFLIINSLKKTQDNLKFYNGKKIDNLDKLYSNKVKLLNQNEILKYLLNRKLI